MVKIEKIKPLVLALSLGLVACSAALTQTYAGTPDTSGIEGATSVAYGNGRYVAVGPKCGISGSGSAQTYVSTDGKNWQTYTPFSGSSPHYCMDAVIYANNQYVAMGMGYAGNYFGPIFMTSSDGKTWSPSIPPIAAGCKEKDPFHGINYVNGQYMVFSGSGGDCPQEVSTSSDGRHWNGQNIFPDSGAFSTILTAVVYRNDHYFALSNHPAELFTSTDGKNWESYTDPQPTGPNSSNALIYANNQYVAAGSSIDALKDGMHDWTLGKIIGSPIGQLFSLAYGNGYYVAMGYDSHFMPSAYTSTDGVTWTQHQIADSIYETLTSVIYSNGQFVTVGSQDQGGQQKFVALSSPDGTHWQPTTVVPG